MRRCSGGGGCHTHHPPTSPQNPMPSDPHILSSPTHLPPPFPNGSACSLQCIPYRFSNHLCNPHLPPTPTHPPPRQVSGTQLQLDWGALPPRERDWAYVINRVARGHMEFAQVCVCGGGCRGCGGGWRVSINTSRGKRRLCMQCWSGRILSVHVCVGGGGWGCKYQPKLNQNQRKRECRQRR